MNAPRALWLPLAAWLAATPIVTARAAAPSSDYERYAAELERAEDAIAESDGRTALEAYGKAYAALPASDRLGALGGDVVDRVLELARLTLAATPPDRIMLERARPVLVRYLDEVAAVDPERNVAEATRLRQEIDAALGLNMPEPEPEPVGVEPEPEPDPEPDPEERPDRRPVSRRTAVGVTIGGAATTAIGAGLLGFGAWFRSRNADLAAGYAADHAAGRITDAELNQASVFIDAEEKEATGWLIGGAVVLTAGVGVLTTGIVLLVRHNRAQQARALVVPSWSGLGVVGRF